MPEYHKDTARMQAIIETVIHELWSQGIPELHNLYCFPELICCDAEQRTASYRYNTYPWMENRIQAVHGGIVALLMDNSMGLTALGLYNHHAPTVSMTVNYCRAVPIGEPIEVRTKITSCGRTLVTTSAELLTAESQKLLVTATGTYYARSDLHRTRQILPQILEKTKPEADRKA